MKKFKVSVFGRKHGTVGGFSEISRVVDAELAAGALAILQQKHDIEVNLIVYIKELQLKDASDTPVTPCCGNCGSSNIYASNASVVWELSYWRLADGGDPDNIDCHECDHNGPPIWL